uniref:E1A-binding protein p400-like isoform X2 n=1 Tax=Geotrypetes seraphini TaxID=260995 RepID=A0A6P8RWN7_GEOSA|nr:E1A-binding protein p400-like isoform X2 [Geotrypetes seraphini]
MHHGNGSQNTQHQPQRSRSFTGNEEEQQSQINLPQSPAGSFAPSSSPSGPQSPSYQIQQLIMSRNPVAGQNVNITLQNVGQVVAGNHQITLTPLPIPNPTSPGFQFGSQQRRFEHGSPSYLQVTSPLPQQIQAPNSTQPSPVPVQALQNIRSGTTATGLGMCNQSPTRGFVDASVLVRQISLSPSNGGHFVFQDGSGITQLAQGTQVQIQTGTSTAVQERRLSQPHSQTGGTIHHLGPQSPVASGANMQPLTSPSHITTSNLPPQISSIIQGQLIQQQQQQVLQGQQLSRPMGFDRTTGGMVAAVGANSSFGLTSAPTPTSPSRATGPHGLSNLPLTPSVSTTMKKQSKKLEEIPPASQEDAKMRKRCMEHYHKHLKILKENFKEYLVELFFLQHLQANMMDFLAFKKKYCVPLQTYLRQNDLDLDDEDEEEQSEVINDEVKVVTGKDGQTGTPVAIATQLPPNVSAAFCTQQQPFQQTLAGTANAIEIEAFKRQQTLTQEDPSKWPRLDMGRHGIVFQHSGVASGVPLQQLMPTVQGGMPPTPQTVQLTGQKQSQQQYDPSKGPPVQNAASLHTPPPQLPSRLQPTNVPVTSLPATLQLAQQQQMESPSQPQLQMHVKTQPPTSLQPALHTLMPPQVSQPQSTVSQQTLTLTRPSEDSIQASQRLLSNSLPTSFMAPTTPSSTTSLPALPPQASRTPQAANKSLSSVTSKATGFAGAPAHRTQSSPQSTVARPQESSQDKLAEQVKLENQVYQRIAELRKEGLWSLRRLPKLQEASRPKSHWDYLLEEMQWMATDFAQERRWKMNSAKKLIRVVACHHEEKKVNEEKVKKEEWSKLKHIAAAVAREIEYFWSNIEQVVEIKLMLELQEKKKSILNVQNSSKKGNDNRYEEGGFKIGKEDNASCRKRGSNIIECGTMVEGSLQSPCRLSKDVAGSDLGRSKGLPTQHQNLCRPQDSVFLGRKRKASTSWTDEEAEDEEETIEEQESREGIVDRLTELSDLAKEADLPLDDLKKQYEGAYAENFLWPQPTSDSEEEASDQETNGRPSENVPKQQVVLIDSLLCTDQHRDADRASAEQGTAKKRTRDIAELAALAELLLPRGTARITAMGKLNIPFLLHGVLKEYQQIGLDWLAKQYKRNLNGILADETGLGKNVLVIALLAHLACNEGNWGPHLLIVRSCKILKWELELKRWCPAMKILLYIGSQRERRKMRQVWTEPNSFNVCITSYKQLFKGHQAFQKMSWKYLILDEVQQIRNMNQKHWDALFSLQSQYRLLLRDTPLQNNLMELWTMVHFLIPGISRKYLDFPVKLDNEESQDYCHKLVIRLHRMIQPFILRRTKRDVEKQLTKKYEHVLKCHLSNRQKALYEDVMLQPGTQETLKSGHFVSVLHVLMQLQRICNHPDLEAPRPSRSPYISETLQYNTASLVLTVLDCDCWARSDMSMFDLIRLENEMSHYEAQVLPKLKVTKKLIDEISSSPDPPTRPAPVKIKPNRLFQAVPYGQKPEGKTVMYPSVPAQRTMTTSATLTQQGQVRGRSPIVAASANQGGEVVKIAQLTSIAGAQGRITQAETPVTLQFQGSKFTLSQSQLRQLTAGQPLQLQGSVLQIVSAPSQQYLRQQGAGAMQLPVLQAGIFSNAISASGNQQQASVPGSAAVTQLGRATFANSSPGEQGSLCKPAPQDSIQESMEQKNKIIKERLDRIFFGNERRCSQVPVYGRDLLEMCCLTYDREKMPQNSTRGNTWMWAGFVNCCHHPSILESSRSPLQCLILPPGQQEEYLQHVVKRVMCVVPVAVAASPCLYVANPPPSYTQGRKKLKQKLAQQWAPCLQQLRWRSMPLLVQFPDLWLVQCDSGKLEALAVLLQKLKSEGRRVLIFSQMLLMLDILEIFLNIHFFSFVRIDEHFNDERRQELMRSFNQDRRIFCAILSTHGCSVGIDLVEADTVVFYDIDINPVIDAKVQEWCDQVGRSKDIHIYRLVSGNSIEEKLLKNGTKDLIREVAAQGNDYSMAFLTQQTIQELFEIYSPHEDSGFGVKAEEFVMLSQDPSLTESIAPKFARPFIEALNGIRQEEEEVACMAESGAESLMSETCEVQYSEQTEEQKELATVVEQLTPIEKYALNYLECFYTSSDEEKQETEELLKTAKREWEIHHLKELQTREAQMLGEEEELFTYTREDAYNKEFVFESSEGQTEIMPLWTPPTPPQDDNDIYIDSVMCLMYDTTPVPESKLPPIYIRKERKRHKMDPAAAGRKKKQRHGDTVIPPRSLFDRATPGLLKMRREGKEQKKNILLKQQTQFAKPLPTLVKPPAEAGPDNPEWLIGEDWALLQAVKQLLELPLNLSIISPAHTPNWDLVSDVVNSCSRIYRSSKQCRNRYESVIIPREEGKIKNSRPLRTNQIYAQDEGTVHTQLYTNRFEIMKGIAGKRSPPIKPLLGMNPFQKNPKHASVLAESGISYDKPLPPIQVASLRAERIAKEKKALVEHHRAQQQASSQPHQQSNGQQQTLQPSVQQSAQSQAQAQSQTVQQPQAVVQTTVPTLASATVLASNIKTTVAGTSIQTATVSGNVIVNTVAGVPSATFQPVNKRLASPVTLATTGSGASAQVVHTQQRTVAVSAAPTEVVTIGTNQGVRAVTPVTASAVVSTSLTSTQAQSRSLATQGAPAMTTGVQLSGKTITPAHFQLLRQQQATQVPVSQIQAQSPTQIKTVGKISQEQLLKLQKQKLQLPQQQAAQPGAQQNAPVPLQQAQAQPSPQISTVTATRPGAVLTGTTVANLQVTRLLQAQGQPAQTAQVALAKPPVVSVPAAVVSSTGVTTLPVTVAGISVAIGQPQKAAAGQTVVAQPLNVQQLLKLKQHHATQQQQQQKTIQPQTTAAQTTVQQKITAQQVTVQSQQQKVTYTTQSAIKTQFLTTPISPAQKAAGTLPVQAQIQVSKLPQVVQQQTAVTSLQAMGSTSQVQPQTVTLTQTTASGQQQVIPAGSTAGQVVQQKII